MFAYIEGDKQITMDPTIVLSLADQIKESINSLVEGGAEDIKVYSAILSNRITMSLAFDPATRERLMQETKAQLLLLAEKHRLKVAKESQDIFVATIGTIQQTLVTFLPKIVGVLTV